MSTPSYFAALSTKRKAALALAIVLGLFSWAWVTFAIMRTDPARWSVPLAVVVVTLGALSSAIILVELVRPFFRAAAAWADREHFRLVAILFAVLAVVQNVGVLVAMSAHGVYAFYPAGRADGPKRARYARTALGSLAALGHGSRATLAVMLLLDYIYFQANHWMKRQGRDDPETAALGNFYKSHNTEAFDDQMASRLPQNILKGLARNSIK